MVVLVDPGDPGSSAVVSELLSHPTMVPAGTGLERVGTANLWRSGWLLGDGAVEVPTVGNALEFVFAGVFKREPGTSD